MTTPYTRPNLAAAGFRFTGAPRGVSPASVQAADNPLKRYRKADSPVATLIPPFIPLPAFATRITVPATTTYNTSAWYGLGSFTPDDLGREFGVFGVDCTLAPCDVDGVGVDGAGSPTAWGDVRGASACVVVGVNLPSVKQGAWTDGPAPFPGIEQNAGSWLSTNGLSGGVLFRRSFPPGKISDTTPNKLFQPYVLGGYIERVTNGRRLDVALVCRGSQITNAGAAKTLSCFIDLSILAVDLETARELSRP